MPSWLHAQFVNEESESEVKTCQFLEPGGKIGKTTLNLNILYSMPPKTLFVHYFSKCRYFPFFVYMFFRSYYWTFGVYCAVSRAEGRTNKQAAYLPRISFARVLYHTARRGSYLTGSQCSSPPTGFGKGILIIGGNL